MGSPKDCTNPYSYDMKPRLPPLCFRNELYDSQSSLKSVHAHSSTRTASTPLQDSQQCLIALSTASSCSLLSHDGCNRKQNKSSKTAAKKACRTLKEHNQKRTSESLDNKKNAELFYSTNLSKEYEHYGSMTKCKHDMLSGNKGINDDEIDKNHGYSDSKANSRESGPQSQYLKKLRLHTYGCVISLAISLMCLYSCFLSLKSLQSTVHATWYGLGVTSLSCIYAAGVISCLIAPLVIELFGHKFTMCSSILLFLVYIGCNMLPREHLYFLIPASLLLGLALGLLWTSVCAFLTSSVRFYSTAIKSRRPEELLCMFNGIFYTIFSAAHFWAHLISGVVLNTAGNTSQDKGSYSTARMRYQYNVYENDSTSESLFNATTQSGSLNPVFTSQSLKCGGHFEAQISPLFGDQTPASDNINPDATHNPLATNPIVAYKAWFLLCSVYVILVIVSVIIILLFVRKRPEVPVQSPEDGKEQMVCHDGLNKEGIAIKSENRSHPVGILSLFKDPRLQLLVPLIVFTAMKESFVYSDYTKYYISCSMGVRSIGMVMITYGVLFTTGSLFIGLVVKHIKSHVILVAGAMFEAGNMMVLLWWKPHVGDVEIFYVLAASMGVCDAIWKTQINVTLGVLFYDKLEAAFALHRLVTFLGLSLAFACSHFLLIRTKIYIMGVLLVIGLGMYAVVHLKSSTRMKTADRVTLRLVPLVSV